MSRLLYLVLGLVLVLVACGNPNPTSPTPAASPTSSAGQTTPTLTTAGATTTSTSPAATTTAAALPRIKVEDGVKTSGLDTLSVRVGDTVRFEVEADIADEVHVHGYDLSFKTNPSEATLVEFVADATGIFEVELEGLGLPIVDIEVTP